MSLPTKYILIGNNYLNDSFLLQSETIPVTTELNIRIKLFKLSNSTIKIIADALKANSCNNEFYDKIAGKQLLIELLYNLEGIQNLIIEMLNILNTPGAINYSKIRFLFNYSLYGNLTLDMAYSEIKELYDYFQDYCSNYNTWKLAYFGNNPSIEPINNAITNENINRPIASIVTQNQNQQNDTVELSSPTISFEACLNDLLNINSDNLFLYFLNKYINIYLESNQIENEYQISVNEKKELFITIEPLIPNYLVLFSNTHYNGLLKLYHIVNNINREIRLTKLYNLFKQIVFICNYILKDTEQYKNQMHLILKLYDMVFFIYALTLSNIDSVNNALAYPKNDQKYTRSLFYNMTTIIQSAFDYFVQNVKNINYSRVIINHPIIVTYKDQSLEKLKEIIFQNRYLLKLQNDEEYIKTIKEEYLNKKNNENTSKKELQLEYNSSKIIDINNYITDKEYTSPLLQYKLLDTNLKNNKIISEEYYQILSLAYNKSENIPKLIPFLSKYSDIILSKILQSINTDYQAHNIKEPISLIDILHKYITNNLPTNTSIETELQILYRIVIPYFYDICKITVFIDCFH